MLTLDMLRAIDERVRRGEQNIVAFGTVAAATSDNDVSVTFDGSAAAIPCKMFGDTQAFEGDRVGLVRIGPWWVAFGSFTRRWPAANGDAADQTSSGTTTSSSWGPLPTDISWTFTKAWDATRVRCSVHASTRTDVASTRADFGLRFASPDQATTDQPVANFIFNDINSHRTTSGVKYVLGATLPAGTYTVTVIWRRLSGTGTLFLDSNDKISADCQEVSP